ncbi:MAG: hypothetical protein AAGA17_16660 [Actinomycetota bacterium]
MSPDPPRWEVLTPTFDEDVTSFRAAPRLGSVSGTTIGIVSNGKHGTAPFFDALADELRSGHDVAEVVHVVKRNYSAPAGDEILDRTRRWNALVSGIGD